MEKVDKYLSDHIEYLDEQYELGYFLASGRKNPRTGGIILSKTSDRNELMETIDKDPFKINDIADYELIEFVPTKTCKELEFLKE